MIFHVSTAEGAAVIRRARGRGHQDLRRDLPAIPLPDGKDDLDKPGLERREMDVLAPDPHGRRIRRPSGARSSSAISTPSRPTMRPMPTTPPASSRPARTRPSNRSPTALPGLEARMPLLFDAMVSRGRLGLESFVDLTATAPARIYNLPKTKGSVAVGYRRGSSRSGTLTSTSPSPTPPSTTVTGFTPFAGRTVQGLAGDRAAPRGDRRSGGNAEGQRRNRPLARQARRRCM
jgi:dihydropyrimidinase